MGTAQGEQQGIGDSHSQEPQARRVKWRDGYQNPERAAIGRGSLTGVVVFSRGTVKAIFPWPTDSVLTGQPPEAHRQVGKGRECI